MILHFEDPDGERLNVNFDRHLYNDIKYKAFFVVNVSKIDFYQIMQEMDFNEFAYSKTDPTITPDPANEPIESEAMPF